MKISRRDLFSKSFMAVRCSTVGIFASSPVKAEAMKEKETKRFFKLYPVGRVERQGKLVQLHIFDEFRDALKGLDSFSHAFVLYWFHKNDTPKKRNILQVYPRGNKKNPLTGVFACRAPVRPNLIALSLCKILLVKNGIVRVDKIDALNESPVLDIKPYIPRMDSIAKGAWIPDWLKG